MSSLTDHRGLDSDDRHKRVIGLGDASSSTASTSSSPPSSPPPSFPAINSQQRVKSSSSNNPKSAAPPRPPPPTFHISEPSNDLNSDDEDENDDEDGRGNALPPIRIEEESLKAPTSTVKKGKRVKVNIEKGYSQLDWARLQRSGEDLRVSTEQSSFESDTALNTEDDISYRQGGVTSLMRITPAMMAQHKSRDDCWQAYGGKVYDVTRFLKFHPGGVGEMMRVAGKDGQSQLDLLRPRLPGS